MPRARELDEFEEIRTARIEVYARQWAQTRRLDYKDPALQAATLQAALVITLRRLQAAGDDQEEEMAFRNWS